MLKHPMSRPHLPARHRIAGPAEAESGRLMKERRISVLRTQSVVGVARFLNFLRSWVALYG